MAAAAKEAATANRAVAPDDGKGITEDVLALAVGLLFFLLALPSIAGVDLLGWAVTTSVWTHPDKVLAPISKSYASVGGLGALLATYLVLLVVLTAGAVALRLDARRFALRFSVVFALSYVSWILGSFANFAAVTPADLQKFGLT